MKEEELKRLRGLYAEGTKLKQFYDMDIANQSMTPAEIGRDPVAWMKLATESAKALPALLDEIERLKKIEEATMRFFSAWERGDHGDKLDGTNWPQRYDELMTLLIPTRVQ